MYQKLDYIFIDLDGPILDGKLRHYNCYRDILIRLGGIPIDINSYWELKRNKATLEMILNKSSKHIDPAVFKAQWDESIENLDYLKYDLLKPMVLETLSIWKQYSNNVFLVTMRNNSVNLHLQLHDLGVGNSFDKVICCSSTNILNKFNMLKDILFDRAIFIGDTEADSLTALNLGIKMIGVTNGIRTRKLLSADYYVEEIKDINMSHFTTSNLSRRCK